MTTVCLNRQAAAWPNPLLLLAALLLLSSCSSLQHWLRLSSVPVSSANGLQQQALKRGELLGQLDVVWPGLGSNRALVNNRQRFTGYSGQGSILLDMGNSQSLVLNVNGRQLSIMPPPELGPLLVLDISDYTRNGVNQLALSDIQPVGTTVRLVVPYPQLTDSTPEAAGFSATALSELDDYIQHEVAQGFPGAVLLIAKDGKIVKHTAYGYANRYRQDGTELTEPEPMQLDTLFDLASNTKMYATNYALMQLVSSGRLDINKPVQHYIAEYQGDGREQRLVIDLLQHTAGYDAEVHFHRPDNRHGAMFYSLDRQRSIELITTAVPFVRQRGEKAVYSDIDYMLLGLLVERITGMTLDSYLEQLLYQPMGLHNTLFNPLQKGLSLSRIAATELDGNSRGGRVVFPADKRSVVRGFVHDEKARYAFDGVAGHAGLFSTAHDTAQLAFMALSGGYGLTKVFSEATLAQFVSPSAADATMGLGWRTAVGTALNWQFGPYASRYAFGHTGWTGTVTLIDPYYQLVIVLLTNKKHSPIISEGENSYYFAGDRFETGMYGSIMSKIYAAMQ